MKIVSLQVENLKRLTAVYIEPDGNMVQITGKNGQGKTSVLDAIWWVLAGTSNVQASPIRKGEERAVITLDLGELKITRTFIAQKSGKYTTSITVENTDGARFQSPQKMLDDVLGELTFDPLVFSRMKNDDQVNALRSLVKGYDFDAAALEVKDYFAERTIQNRIATKARSTAETMAEELPEGDVPTFIDSAVELKNLEDAMAHNKAQISFADAIGHNKTLVAEYESKIEDLKICLENVMAESSTLEIPAVPIDLEPIREKIFSAKQNNKIVEIGNQHDEQIEIAIDAENKSKQLTARIDKRKTEARDAIAQAELPVEGIDIIDGAILLNGIPFEQASDAEQLSVSIGIAMALNPKLKVIRVRDGSLLDEDALKALSVIADENDYQIWIERVDSTGIIGFVMEDGHVKGQDLKLAE